MRFTSYFSVIFLCIISLLIPSVPIKADEASSDHVSVLLLGVNTGDFGRIEQGRSDTIMVLDINLNTNLGVIVSIPRDAYVEIEGYGLDKINHAYAFGGSELSLGTVNNFLDTNIQDYIVVNMAGLKEIIEVVGTIEVVPPTSFSLGDYTFTEGVPTEIDSDMALTYARERYTSGGDYARQERQREIVQAIIKKAASFESVVNFVPMFSALSDNIQTNMTIPQLVNLFRIYNSTIDVSSYQLVGYGEMIDGIYYDKIDDESLSELKKLLHN